MRLSLCEPSSRTSVESSTIFTVSLPIEGGGACHRSANRSLFEGGVCSGVRYEDEDGVAGEAAMCSVRFWLLLIVFLSTWLLLLATKSRAGVVGVLCCRCCVAALSGVPSPS